MKLIVQIPCHNEQDTLAETIADLPVSIPGCDIVEVLVIDDGSTDNTVEVARRAGVDHVVHHPRRLGLARAFETGIETCLRLGADIIVNTDGDHQYCGAFVTDLVQPILDTSADVVVGDRQTNANEEFSWAKKRLQRAGTGVVNRLSGTDVGDAFSGFRAYSRAAAVRIDVLSDFSYTVETLMHAGQRGVTVASVPVDTNAARRPSRLASSTPSFIAHQSTTMIRFAALHRGLSFFVRIGVVTTVLALIPFARFMWSFVRGNGDGHVQSLIFGLGLLLFGLVCFVVGLLADLITGNRRLIEKTLVALREVDPVINIADGSSATTTGHPHPLESTSAIPASVGLAERHRTNRT